MGKTNADQLTFAYSSSSCRPMKIASFIVHCYGLSMTASAHRTVIFFYFVSFGNCQRTRHHNTQLIEDCDWMCNCKSEHRVIAAGISQEQRRTLVQNKNTI